MNLPSVRGRGHVYLPCEGVRRERGCERLAGLVRRVREEEWRAEEKHVLVVVAALAGDERAVGLVRAHELEGAQRRDVLEAGQLDSIRADRRAMRLCDAEGPFPGARRRAGKVGKDGVCDAAERGAWHGHLEAELGAPHAARRAV